MAALDSGTSRVAQDENHTLMLWSCVLLAACVGGHGARQQYNLDTVTNTCLKNPANCPPVVEQHEVALRCASEKLSKLKPGGFTLTPRYCFDPRTGTTEYIPREVVEELLRQGRGEELRGTLEPDLVIHEGTPRRVLGAYDFKFPCVNTDRRMRWREYPEGHPAEVEDQGELYKKALQVKPAQVQPRVGVFR